MKDYLAVTITSLFSILLMTLHFTSDTLRAHPGSPEAGGSTLVGAPILVLWLYGTLMLAGRRSGHIIMLLGSLIAIAMPVLHVMFSAGLFQGQLARGSSGDFIFVWTLQALGVTGLFLLILSLQGLSSMRRAQNR
jgi:hypothetical protein